MAAVIYFDGGTSWVSSQKKKKRQLVISYGVVAHTNGETHEIQGSVRKSNFEVSTGCHELVALFEAVLFAYNRGLQARDCSFYTDDLLCAYASFYLCESNGKRRTRDKIIEQIKYICKMFYESNTELEDVVLHYLLNARFSKVKGHSGVVDNSRADYLVRQARKKAPIAPYVEWLKLFCSHSSYVEGGPRDYSKSNIGLALMGSVC